jgi:hypothetical protein
VDPGAGMDDVKKKNSLTAPGLELRSLGCSARSQSLYRLRNPGSTNLLKMYERYPERKDTSPVKMQGIFFFRKWQCCRVR